MSNKWAFETLNQISPLSSYETSPANGVADDLQRSADSLSFPVSGPALQQQLEAWTNVAFDFDQSPPSTGFSLPPLNEGSNKEQADKRAYEAALGLHNNGNATINALQSSVATDLTLPSSVAPFPFNAPSQSSLNTDPYLSELLQPAASSSDADAVIPPAATIATALPLSTTSTRAGSPSPQPVASTSKRGPAKNRKPSKVQVGPNEPLTEDQLNQLALEEDKRRRNTAASARFRIKKKQREAALESTAKELRDKVSALEKEVDSLRTENGWLRSLIVDSAQREAVTKKDGKRAAEASTAPTASKRARVENDGEAGPERLPAPVKSEVEAA